MDLIKLTAGYGARRYKMQFLHSVVEWRDAAKEAPTTMGRIMKATRLITLNDSKDRTKQASKESPQRLRA